MTAVSRHSNRLVLLDPKHRIHLTTYYELPNTCITSLKEAESNLNFSTVCRMVDYIFGNLADALLGVLGHQTFLVTANVRNSSKLFIALSLQATML